MRTAPVGPLLLELLLISLARGTRVLVGPALRPFRVAKKRETYYARLGGSPHDFLKIHKVRHFGSKKCSSKGEFTSVPLHLLGQPPMVPLFDPYF